MGKLSAADMFALTKREPVSNFSKNQNPNRQNAVSKMVSKAVIAGSVMLATQLEASEKEEKNMHSTDDIQTGSLSASEVYGRGETESTSTDTIAAQGPSTNEIAYISNGTTGSINSAPITSPVLSETGLPRDFISQSPGVSDPAQITREIPQEIANFDRAQQTVNIIAGSSSQSPVIIEVIDGEDGIDGKDGRDGNDGQNGLDGADGSDGLNGKDGLDGEDGVDGMSTVYLDGNIFKDAAIIDLLRDNGFSVEEGPFGSLVIVFDPARADELINLLDAYEAQNPAETEEQTAEPEHGTRTRTGTEQDDFLSGDESDNVISGFGGNDHLSGGTGADTLLGGNGVDTADYRDSLEAVHVDLETRDALFGDAEGDILISIENLAGSSGDDILTGDSGNNRLTGRDGDDILSGGAGDDRLVGGEGADQFIGGEGNRDAADFNLAEEAVGVDLLNGGFMGEAEGDTYEGIEFIVGSAHHDILLGNNENNRINGGEGCDVLNGRDGNDTLIGEAGGDILNGGAGADVFIFGEESGYDIIEDFEAGEGRTDRVKFNHDEYEGFDDILEDMTQTEDGVVLEMDTGTILFQDLQISDFHADDFILA